jgi:acetoin utilization protein AcuB
MLVQDCMTRNPISIRPESDPVAAIGLLKAGGFRHLPVLDDDGRLVGIVDRMDMEMFLSKAGSPGVMKRNHRVDQMMSRNVVSVAPGCPLEEAASLMVQHKIGSLPVLEDGRLVGIITETDIFSHFAAILGGGTHSLRLTVQLDDRPGMLAEVAGCIAGVEGNITSAVAFDAGQPGRMNFTFRVQGVEEGILLQAIAGIEGLEVLHAWQC